MSPCLRDGPCSSCVKSYTVSLLRSFLSASATAFARVASSTAGIADRYLNISTNTASTRSGLRTSFLLALMNVPRTTARPRPTGPNAPTVSSPHLANGVPSGPRRRPRQSNPAVNSVSPPNAFAIGLSPTGVSHGVRGCPPYVLAMSPHSGLMPVRTGPLRNPASNTPFPLAMNRIRARRPFALPSGPVELFMPPVNTTTSAPSSSFPFSQSSPFTLRTSTSHPAFTAALLGNAIPLTDSEFLTSANTTSGFAPANDVSANAATADAATSVSAFFEFIVFIVPFS